MDYNKPLPLSPGEIVRSLSTHASLRTSTQPQFSQPARLVTSADWKYYDSSAFGRTSLQGVPAKHQLKPVYELEDTSESQEKEPAKMQEQPLS